jgi:hypothetical protein
MFELMQGKVDVSDKQAQQYMNLIKKLEYLPQQASKQLMS